MIQSYTIIHDKIIKFCNDYFLKIIFKLVSNWLDGMKNKLIICVPLICKIVMIGRIFMSITGGTNQLRCTDR